jgi:hypothetical protein
MFLDKHCRVAYFSAQYISLRNAGEPIFRVSFLAKKPALSGAECGNVGLPDRGCEVCKHVHVAYFSGCLAEARQPLNKRRLLGSE